jgi:hypothetical protein
VIWSAANDAGPFSITLQIVQDPTGIGAMLAEETEGSIGCSVCAVVQVVGEAPAAERTIRFDALGQLGVNLVRCRILIRRLSP